MTANLPFKTKVTYKFAKSEFMVIFFDFIEHVGHIMMKNTKK
jgi:hypothetical protein